MANQVIDFFEEFNFVPKAIINLIVESYFLLGNKR